LVKVRISKVIKDIMHFPKK